MIAKRTTPCLDVRNGRVVKGVNFEGVRDVADPVEMARMYNAAGADELVFYDITASYEGRALFTDILTRVAAEIFIPLTVGGGINTLEDFDRVLKCGADKVSVNSGALKDPGLIPAAAARYGSQCVVLSADVKRVEGRFPGFSPGGRGGTGRGAPGGGPRRRGCSDRTDSAAARRSGGGQSPPPSGPGRCPPAGPTARIRPWSRRPAPDRPAQPALCGLSAYTFTSLVAKIWSSICYTNQTRSLLQPAGGIHPDFTSCRQDAKKPRRFIPSRLSALHMELLSRFELETSSLPRMRSTN